MWSELPADLHPHHADLTRLTDRYLRHEFDLLGSGWVEVRHGAACGGFAGSRYEPGSSVEADRQGVWLVGRLNDANVATASRVWALVDDGYVPIDWQLDFRSGFRWSERTWYRDIQFMGMPGRDIKLPWELARMQHLPQLALAAHLARRGAEGFEGPDRYEREFRNQVLDFVATNPPRFGVNWAIAMDVAIRATNWLVAWDLFRASGTTFDPAFESILAASIRDHGRFVVANIEWFEIHGNHYLADVCGLLFIAAYLPGDRETDAWLAFAGRELLLEVEHQFWRDGANFEASTAYHRLGAEMVAWSVGLLLALPDDRLRAFADHPAARYGSARPLSSDPIPTPLDVGGRKRPIPSWLPDRLRRMALFTRDVTKPSGRVAQIGDNDSGRFLRLLPALREGREDSLDHRNLVATIDAIVGGDAPSGTDGSLMQALLGRARLPMDPSTDAAARDVRVGDDAVFNELAGHARDATNDHRRTVTIAVDGGGLLDGLEQVAYPDFGFWLFRSQRLWLGVRCGPIGQQGNGGHAHNDQLGIELSIDGTDWLRDPGTYIYTAAPEQRNAYRAAAAHTGPSYADREPARLDIDLFTLGGESEARCEYWGPKRFAGQLRSPGGRRLGCIVEVRGDAVVVRHWSVGAPLAGAHGDDVDWRALRPNVPFSPGYGLVDGAAE